MQVHTRQITVVRVEASEAEAAALRALLAEGLSVVEAITPAMARVAEAFGLAVQEPTPSAEADAPDAPPPKRTRKGG